MNFYINVLIKIIFTSLVIFGIVRGFQIENYQRYGSLNDAITFEHRYVLTSFRKFEDDKLLVKNTDGFHEIADALVQLINNNKAEPEKDSVLEHEIKIDEIKFVILQSTFAITDVPKYFFRIGKKDNTYFEFFARKSDIFEIFDNKYLEENLHKWRIRNYYFILLIVIFQSVYEIVALFRSKRRQTEIK